jgi:hypothetical protein
VKALRTKTRVLEKGMLLLRRWYFYEFIPRMTSFEENAPRLTIGEVTIGVNYAPLSLLQQDPRANIGAHHVFTSTAPTESKYRGRLNIISASGEHVTVVEVETAMQQTADEHNPLLMNFIIAPTRSQLQEHGLYHECILQSWANKIRH